MSAVAPPRVEDLTSTPGAQLSVSGVEVAHRVPTLAETFSSRRNSIAFLRWFFAVSVVVDHTYAIARFDHGQGLISRWTAGQDSLGGLAVAGFFVLSGFLVSRSRDRMASGLRYLWHRVLRIFPGFWVCLLVTAVVLAPIEWHFESGKGISALFSYRNGPWQYLRANYLLTIHQWTIGPLLSHTPRAQVGASAGAAWDGSLWSLIYEFRCYIVVAVVGLIASRLVRRRTFVVLTILMAGLVAVYEVMPKHTVLHTFSFIEPFIAPAGFVRLAFCFALGALLYFYADSIPIRGELLALSAAVFLVTLHYGGLYLIGFVAFAYCILGAAVRLPIYRWDRFGDLSYGIYIYAFPAQMLLAAHNFQRFGLLAFLLASITISSLAAFASWHLVEKNALRLKSLAWPRRLRLPPVGELAS